MLTTRKSPYRRAVRLLLLFLLPASLVISVHAQPNVMFDHYREVDGLSHRWVRSICRDSTGFLWIGTFNGLNRFDGQTFIHFDPPDKKSGGDFAGLQLYCDKYDMLWIKSWSTYYHFNPHTLTYQQLPSTIGQIFVTDKGNPFVWFEEGKYEQLSPSEKALLDSLHLTLIPFNIEHFGIPLDYICEVNPSLLIGFYSKGPSFRIDLKETSFRRTHTNESLPMAYLEDPVVNNAIEYFDPQSGALTSFTFPDTLPDAGWERKFFVDNTGTYWFTHNKHPYTWFFFDIHTRTLRRGPHLGDLPFESIYFQNDGVVWLGHEQGLSKFTAARNLFQRFLSRSFVSGTIPPIGYSAREIWDWENGTMLIHSNNDPFLILNPQTGTTKPLERLTESPYTSFKVNDSLLWFVPYYGNVIVRYNPFTGSQKKIDIKPTIHSSFIAVDADGYVWVRRAKKILKIDPSASLPEPIHDVTTHSAIHGIFMTKDRQEIIFRFADTIAIFNCKTHETNFFPDHNLHARQITWVNTGIRQGDTLWMATTTGLYSYNIKTQSSNLYTRNNGLVHANIYTILPDGRYLWLGTHDGLVRFDKINESIRTFGVVDGLPHHEFNSRSAYISKDGSYYMGGLNGIIRFFPRDLDDVTWQKYKIVLSAFEKHNPNKESGEIFWSDGLFKKNSDGQTVISLKPWENDFTIHFALTDFSNAPQHTFLFYLEDTESPWTHLVQLPQASYLDLRPGNYVFHAKALNARGLPSNELVLHIHVAQFWYLQWWAWVIYAVAALFLAFLFYRYQINRKLAMAEAGRLRELDHFKTRFYTNITHEFRTPLTVILGMNENLRELHRKKETAKIEQAVKMIRRNSRQLLRLVGQILDLSKIDSGSLKMHFEQGDIIPYLRYLSESFRSLAATKGVELHFLSEEKEFVMAIDREKLLHIITNLVSNAVKFTPRDGNIYLQVEKSQWQGGEALRIRVRDTGAGIAQEALPMIFDRFYSANGHLSDAESSVVRRGSGAGIGLALVKELVRLWKGDITVESIEGAGSTFTILLPRNFDPLAESEFEFNEIPSDVLDDFGNPVASHSNGIHSASEQLPLLLIAEDNVDVVHYLTTCLDQEYRLLITYDGKEGLEKALEHIPDVVISDVMMPEMDGFQLCYSIKNDQRTSHIPVVLLTAKEDSPARLTGLRKGADAYLTKPFNPEELHIRLQKLVELRNILRQKFSGYIPAEKPTEEEKKNPESQFLRSIHALIQQHMDDSGYGIPQLCKSLGLSQSQLFRKLKALTGKSTALYIRSIRLAKAKELLSSSDKTVSEIAYEVGFSDPAYFSRCFSEEFGRPPVAMRN